MQIYRRAEVRRGNFGKSQLKSFKMDNFECKSNEYKRILNNLFFYSIQMHFTSFNNTENLTKSKREHFLDEFRQFSTAKIQKEGKELNVSCNYFLIFHVLFFF